MSKEYKLNRDKKMPESLVSIDRKKRDKVEKILGKKLNETEWFNYKLMLRGIKR